MVSRLIEWRNGKVGFSARADVVERASMSVDITQFFGEYSVTANDADRRRNGFSRRAI